MQTKVASQPPEYCTWSGLHTVTTFDAGTTPNIEVDKHDITVEKVKSFSPKSLLVESLIEQLCRLLEKNPKNQKKVYNVVCHKLYQMKLIDKSYSVEEFEFMRIHYQRALFHLLKVAKSTTLDTEDVKNTLLQFPRSPTKLNGLHHSSQLWLEDWSRYRTEYEELEYLAHGGFGHVFRVRNKLDGMEYAIKKICLRYRNMNCFLHSLREVKTLAKLNHPNIVTYKAAWLEPMSKNMERKAQDNGLQFSSGRQPVQIDTLSTEDDSGGIVFAENSETKSENSSVGNLFIFSSQEASNDEDGSSSDVGQAVCKYQNGTERACDMWQHDTSMSFLQEWAVLYVQMQLCERTLKQWLDVRNSTSTEVNLKESLNIFKQIVQGVCYIHSQKIVHHDIKPSNIFVNSDLSQIQVGDFGLACCLQHSVQDVTVLASKTAHEHKGEIGTKLYAAPEQLRGKCNSKSDLYSLGIVLFELLQIFSTDMERCKVINRLRAQRVPPEGYPLPPKLSEIISELLSPSPDDRPSAENLLSTVKALIREYPADSVVPTQNETVQHLLDIISERDREIEELKQKLRALEVNKA